MLLSGTSFCIFETKSSKILSTRQRSRGSERHQQIPRFEMFIQRTNKKWSSPEQREENSQNLCLQPAIPRTKSLLQEAAASETQSDLKKVTARGKNTSYFQKSYHAFISLKNIFSLLQATRCLCFIAGSKAATEENQNNLPYWHDLSRSGTKLIQSYTPTQNVTMLHINIFFDLLPLN